MLSVMTSQMNVLDQYVNFGAKHVVKQYFGDISKHLIIKGWNFFCKVVNYSIELQVRFQNGFDPNVDLHKLHH